MFLISFIYIAGNKAYDVNAAERKSNGLFDYEEIVGGNRHSIHIFGISDSADKDFTSLTIPGQIDGVPVESVGVYDRDWYKITNANNFDECKNLKTLIIEEGIKYIEADTFEDCKNLESVTLPESIISISDNAFCNCSNLSNIVLPENLEHIASGAFANCKSLKKINIPATVTFLGNSSEDDDYFRNPFEGCSAITSISVEPNNSEFYSSKGTDNYNAILTKSNYLLVGCSNTKIPSNVVAISRHAFNGCSGLTSIEIPDSVTSIGLNAFYGCSGLTSIKIPDSVTSIDWGAFYGCSGLTSIEIPDNVTSIGYGAFGACSNLTSIKVAEGNTVYDSRDNCNAIIKKENNTLILGCKNTIIPKSVTSIEGNYLSYGGAFSGCVGLTSISLPEGLTSIGVGAFRDCTGLTSITLPESLTSIGDSAFYDCGGLTSVTLPEGLNLRSVDS